MDLRSRVCNPVWPTEISFFTTIFLERPFLNLLAIEGWDEKHPSHHCTYLFVGLQKEISFYSLLLALVHLIPSWILWAKIECTVNTFEVESLFLWAFGLALVTPKATGRSLVYSALLLVNQFKPIQHSRQQALRAYCPNIYKLCFQPNIYTTSRITMKNGPSTFLVYHSS